MAYTGIDALEDLRANKVDRAFPLIEKINQVLMDDLTEWNQVLQEYMAFIAESTTEAYRVGGGSYMLKPSRSNEYTRGRTQMDAKFNEIYFPMDMYDLELGFTEEFLQKAKVAEVAEKYAAANIGWLDNMYSEIKRALFKSANYDCLDHFDNRTLHVKRLINADGSVIPNYGQVSFDGSTHTHYLATAALANADVEGLVNHVKEHGGRDLGIYINGANATAFTALTGFHRLTSGLIIPGSASEQTLVKNNANSDPNDCQIGYFDVSGMMFPVYIKPASMIPLNYILCAATSSTNERALCFRQDTDLKGIIMQKSGNGVLRVDKMIQYYGFGANGRTSAAILYTGGAAWTDCTTF